MLSTKSVAADQNDWLKPRTSIQTKSKLNQWSESTDETPKNLFFTTSLPDSHLNFQHNVIDSSVRAERLCTNMKHLNVKM